MTEDQKQHMGNLPFNRAQLGFQGQPFHIPGVNGAPFAGRVGGLGCDILYTGSDSDESLLKAIPDAAPIKSWSQIFDFQAFRTPILWKASLIEGMGECHTFVTEIFG
jgi:hypothetical protein